MLNLYGIGKATTGLIIEVSSNKIGILSYSFFLIFLDIIPIIETAVQYHAIFSIPVGGKHVREALINELETDASFKREFALNNSVKDQQELLDYLLENILEVGVASFNDATKKTEHARTQIIWNEKKVHITNI